MSNIGNKSIEKCPAPTDWGNTDLQSLASIDGISYNVDPTEGPAVELGSAHEDYFNKGLLPVISANNIGFAGSYDSDSVSFLPNPRSADQILKITQGFGKAVLEYGAGMRQMIDHGIVKYAPIPSNYAYSHLKHPEIYKETAVKTTVLKGMNDGYKRGIVSEEELEAAMSFVTPKDLKVYTATQLAYVATSIIGNIATPPLMVTAGSAKEVLAIYAGGGLATGGVRSFITKIIGHKTNSDLKTAIKYAAIPQAGLYLAVPKQIQDSYGGEQSKIAHYNRRWLYGKIGYAYFGKGGMGSKGEDKVTACVEKSKEHKSKILGLAAQYAVYRSIGINMLKKG